jgi:hypothetical protein
MRSESERGEAGGDHPEVIVCESLELTPDDIELSKWGSEAIKQTETSLQDGLKQMVVLLTAVLAGSVNFLQTMPKFPKGLMVSSFLLGLCFAVYGFLPRTLHFRPGCLTEMRAERERLLRIKDRCLTAAMIGLLLGGLFGVVGMIFS